MRIWHTFLIEALPREQLVSQWREISSIVGAIQKNGTPNHILVNFVTRKCSCYGKCPMRVLQCRRNDGI